MIGQLFTGFLEDKDKTELPDVTLLNASLQGLSASLEGDQPYVSLFNGFFPKELSDLSEQAIFLPKTTNFSCFW